MKRSELKDIIKECIQEMVLTEKGSGLKDIIKECIQEMGLTEPVDKFDVDALFENACIDIEESKAIEDSLLMKMY